MIILLFLFMIISLIVYMFSVISRSNFENFVTDMNKKIVAAEDELAVSLKRQREYQEFMERHRRLEREYEEYLKRQHQQSSQPKKKQISAYDVLEISNPATLEEVKRAYKRLALKYHPDKNNSKDAQLKMRLINDARDLLVKKLGG